MPQPGLTKSCPVTLLFPVLGSKGFRSLPQPCSAAFHVPDTFSGSHIPRSPAQRTAAATSLPSFSNPIVVSRPGVASIQCPGPCASPPERLPCPARGSGDRGGAPGRRRSRAPTPPPPSDPSQEVHCFSECCRIPGARRGPVRTPSASHLKLGRTPPVPRNLTSQALGQPVVEAVKVAAAVAGALSRRPRKQPACPSPPACVRPSRRACPAIYRARQFLLGPAPALSPALAPPWAP